MCYNGKTFSTIQRCMCVFVLGYRVAVWCVHACHVRVLPVWIRWRFLRSAAPAVQALAAIWEKNIRLAPPSLRLFTPVHRAPVWSVWKRIKIKRNPISDGPLGTIASGSSFLHPSSDQNEVVNCQKRPCPVQCSNPVPSDTCCPVCDSCLYEGVVHTHGHTFTTSSNPCQHCTCARGTVTCVPLVCPQTPCLQPVTKPGQCCPECTGACELCNLLY